MEKRKRILSMIVFVISLLTACVLSDAVKADRQSRARAAVNSAIDYHNRQEAITRGLWKISKKITLSEKIPDNHRDRSECTDIRKLKDGWTGYIENSYFVIIQVLGPSDILIGIRNPEYPVLWLTSYTTKNLVSGDNVHVLGLVETAGTKTYTTVSGGSKTVHVIKLVSKERLTEIKKKNKAAALQARWKAESRTWTDKTGKHKTEAIYGGYVAHGKARLLKQDGTEVVVPLASLSELDRRLAVKLRREMEDKK